MSGLSWSRSARILSLVSRCLWGSPMSLRLIVGTWMQRSPHLSPWSHLLRCQQVLVLVSRGFGLKVRRRQQRDVRKL